MIVNQLPGPTARARPKAPVASTRRALAALAALAGTGGTLAASAACAMTGDRGDRGAAPAAPRLSAPVTIQQWVPFGAQWQVDGVGKVAEAFTQVAPEITVQTTPMATPEKLVAAVAAGTGPDVHNRDGGQFRDLIRRGLYLPLDERVARSKTAARSVFTPAQLAAASQATAPGATGAPGQRLFGIPAWSNGSGWFLYWNRDHFIEAGYPPDRGPTTLDEVRAYGERLTRFGSDGQLDRLGFELLTDQHWIDPIPLLAAMWDVTWYDAAARKVRFDQPAMVEALDYAARIYQFLDPARVDTFRRTFARNNTPASGMQSGVESMKIGSDNVFGVSAQNAPDLRLGVTWAPSATRQTWVAQGSGHYAGLVAGTRAPDAAWRFVEFLATPAANQIILDVIGWVVYNKEIARALDVGKLPGLRFILDAPGRAHKIHPTVALPIDPARHTAPGVQRVIRGQQGAREMLQEVTTRVQAEIDEALRTAA